MKIVVPLTENNGEKSRISWHFGRAPYFAIVDTGSNEIKIIENKSEHFGGASRASELVMEYKPDVIFAKGIGPRALDFFKSLSVRVVTGDYETLGELVKNPSKLRELSEGCKK